MVIWAGEWEVGTALMALVGADTVCTGLLPGRLRGSWLSRGLCNLRDFWETPQHFPSFGMWSQGEATQPSKLPGTWKGGPGSTLPWKVFL